MRKPHLMHPRLMRPPLVARFVVPTLSLLVLSALGCSPEPADESIRSQAATTVNEAGSPTVSQPTSQTGSRPEASTDVTADDGDRSVAATALSADPNAIYAPGTCFEPPEPGQAAVEVRCDLPHTIEVYAHDELPAAPGSPYEGLDEATALCDRHFTAITGVGLGLATVYERSVLRPSEETWAAGERDVTCYVEYPRPVTESLVDVNPVRAFGLVSIYGLEVGDCLIDFDDGATTFELLGCDDPHDHEVFVAHRYEPGPYPGDAAVEELATELCYGQTFEDFVGQSYARSAVEVVPSLPLAETWSLGDRTINCLLTDGLIRIGSFAGTGT